jgi:hypothetical protein
MLLKSLRAPGPAVFAPVATIVLAATFVLVATWAQAQPFPPAPGMAARNPVCLSLESQLSAIDRGGGDPARAEQIRRMEDSVNRQKAELDRVTARARQMGCEARGLFSLFSGHGPQCAPVNTQIQQMRANLDRSLAELQRLQGGSADRESQRRSILATLAQNDCGPQYRAYANRGLFEALFGPNLSIPGLPQGDTYRTVCVRTCDGFYFPISYSTLPSRFSEDQKVCQRLCPAADVALYSHRNPGEDVANAVSLEGRRYSELPTAFSYRKQFNPSCSCKAAGQTWADALRSSDDQTLERGDIIVTEERAKQMSQPRVDSKGKLIRPLRAGSQKGGTQADAPAPEIADPAKRQVRTVGPTFLPAR